MKITKNRSLVGLFTFLVFGMSPAMLSAVEVELTAADGSKTILGDVKQMTEGQVTFTKGGREYTLPMDRFDEATQGRLEKVRKQLPKGTRKFSSKFLSGKSNQRSQDENFDDRRERLDPKLTITNEARKGRSEKVVATVVLLARNVVDRDKVMVLSVQQKDVHPLGGGQSAVFDLRGVTYEYDNRGAAQYGIKYIGYGVCLKTESGELVYAKALPASFEKHAEKFDDLVAEEYYTVDLKEWGGSL